MLTGMIMQIVCGNATGMVKTYELHVLCRCLTASTCALMYTSGSAIRKSKFDLEFIVFNELFLTVENIVSDITHGKAKVITSVIFELFWSIGLILLPGLTIFFTNYTNLYMAVSMPTILLIFLHRSVSSAKMLCDQVKYSFNACTIFRQIPNSPRWYLRRGDIRKAKQIVLMAATTNKINVPENLDDRLKAQAEAL